MRNEEGHAAVHCSAQLTSKRHPVKDKFGALVTIGGATGLRSSSPGHMMCGSPIRLRRPIYQQLLAAKPMYLFLHQILKPCGVRFQYVCTEAKRAIMMAGIACGSLGFE